MIISPREQLKNIIRLIIARLRQEGEYPTFKAGRDPIEPGQRNKNRAENELADVINAHFDTQTGIIKDALAGERSNLSLADITRRMKEQSGQTATEAANVFSLSIANGLNLFAESAQIGIDYALVNTAAAVWARQYAYDMITGIDTVSADATGQAIAAFVETPGMTIGDVMQRLDPIFGEARSANIATTEITRAYAQANQLAGEQLKRDFPGVKVIKRWFTNNDEKVCPICRPLNSKVVEVSEKFIGGDGQEYDNPPAHPNCRCWTTTTTRISRD